MELFYHKFGQGQPLIILHGLYGLSDNWVAIGKRLAEHFDVYIPDQRNHGRSPHSDQFNYYALSDDLYDFIEQHQLHKPIILGHSMGGKVGIHFAQEYPDLVDKLIVVDISVRTYQYRKVHKSIIETMRSVDFSRMSSRKQIEEFIAKKISDPRIRLFILKNLDRVSKTEFRWKLNLEVIHQNATDIFQGLLAHSQYTNPTLFIRGGQSDYITNEDYPLILQNFPNADIKTIEQASHWVHADAPDELCKLLNDFLVIH